MNISSKDWNSFINKLSRISDKATDEMKRWLEAEGGLTSANIEEAIARAYAIATKYGEASAALSAAMYDVVAELSGKYLPAAIPAETATYGATAKAIRGASNYSAQIDYIAAVAGRLVKQAGADTTLQNAKRDGAEFAWIPHGDTCAFCLTLASRGWQKASKAALKGDHAEHIHSNCDCTYAIRFDSGTNVSGYDPDRYRDMYYDADGVGPNQKINALRREFYAKNKDRINAQKRAAYAKRRELNSSAAEEFDVDE